MKHTATISKPETSKKFIRGQFQYADGVLDFNCETSNVSFDEVLEALTKLRDECQRQVAHQRLCPFHPEFNCIPSNGWHKTAEFPAKEQ